MEVLNGFCIKKPFTTENAGFCKWAIGERNGRIYFIKEFLTPKFPDENCGLSETTIAKKRAECNAFYAQKAKLYQGIQRCRTGNVVIIQDFFREKSKYYAATEMIEAEKLTLPQIAALPPDKKMVLIRSLLYSFSVLHSETIVHSDIKPDNILLKKTKKGFYAGKIIDFDASFFESDVPDDIQGDQVYLAPEMRLRMMNISAPVTTKSDIFALGILFHQYWCGELPEYPRDYDYLFEAVLDGAEIAICPKLPAVLGMQIKAMLQKDPTKRPSAAEVLQSLERENTEVCEALVSRVKFNGFQ
jgi:non-specific serine/threonine protein kinase